MPSKIQPKYKLTDESIEVDGVKLFRIEALKDFQTTHGFLVKAGDRGGFIEKESNLSHKIRASNNQGSWVSENARVYGEAQVYGNAHVSGAALVYGNAHVYGNARVGAWLYRNGRDAQVYDNAKVYEYATVHDSAHINGNSHVCGFAYMT
jgi:carbonic anhydrase/acetyltransferase-like protein (isoleucine patch superfamily)